MLSKSALNEPKTAATGLPAPKLCVHDDPNFRYSISSGPTVNILATYFFNEAQVSRYSSSLLRTPATWESAQRARRSEEAYATHLALFQQINAFSHWYFPAHIHFFSNPLTTPYPHFFTRRWCRGISRRSCGPQPPANTRSSPSGAKRCRPRTWHSFSRSTLSALSSLPRLCGWQST